jgi:Flp pilus assembly protein TadD
MHRSESPRASASPISWFAWLQPLLLACMLSALPARAAELDSAQAQWLAGHREQAVQILEKALVQTPNELKLRFALGVMRMELGERAKARSIFVGLTQDYPDLADPYNNLAVLLAADGELDEARAALEHAVLLQPNHAQAHENLGDVLLRLALRAYQNARSAQVAPSTALTLKLLRTQAVIDKAQNGKPG